MDINVKRFRAAPEEKVHLDKSDPDGTSTFDGNKKDALKETKRLKLKLETIQEKLFASHQFKVLIVLQGMNTAGKDSAIKLVFEGVNPQGVRVANFKTPSQEEHDHDFLWRVHQ